MVDFKLRTVAQHLGIKLDEAKLHDAMYDIEITKMIYEIVTTRKKNSPPEVKSAAEPKDIEILQESKDQPLIELLNELPQEEKSIDVEPLMNIARNAMRQRMSHQDKADAILQLVKEDLTSTPVEEVTEETLRERGLIL